MIVSIRRSDGKILFNPSGEATIENDPFIAIGHAESLMKLAGSVFKDELVKRSALKSETGVPYPNSDGW